VGIGGYEPKKWDNLVAGREVGKPGPIGWDFLDYQARLAVVPFAGDIAGTGHINYQFHTKRLLGGLTTALTLAAYKHILYSITSFLP
jgi:hypothetical protein